MQELMFQDTSLRAIVIDGQIWLGAADIARALNYAEPGKVTRLYDRHKIEFSNSMTRLVEMPTLGTSANLMTKTRLFSLRGAHLVAMFARTHKGQEFRKWVLDLIDQSIKADGETISLLKAYYDAKARLEKESDFASLCGKGLNRWRMVKRGLKNQLTRIEHDMQPALFLG